MADENTLYYVASRTKFMVAAAVGILVNEGKLSWHTLVSDVLPEFTHPDDDVRNKTTISDLLSHRSGLAQNMAYWMAEHGRLTLEPADFVKTATDLKPVHPVRSRYLYNNWGSGLVGSIIERVAGLYLGEFLQQKLFGPLGIPRTTLRTQPDIENVAKPYLWSCHANQPRLVSQPSSGDGTIKAGAMGA